MRRALAALTVVLVGCSQAVSGPWLDESGQRLEGSQLIQYQGFKECGHEDVQFLVYFGDMYAKDPAGVLGPLIGAAGESLTYTILSEVPEGAVAQGFFFRDQEIYADPETVADYIYIRFGNGNVERWPRAEISCDRPGS